MLEIRLYTDTDLDDVVALWYRSWTHAFPELKHPQTFEQWKFRFQNDYAKQGGVWIATAQNQIVGFVIVSDSIIAQIFVEVEMQNRGIGTGLINHAKSLYPNGLSLTTLKQNQQAQQFYEKHGFVATTAGVNPVNRQLSINYDWKP